MNPYEQRLIDEVIYLHSLWHQGPPTNPNPSSSNSNPYHVAIPNNLSTPSFHIPPNPTTPFKKTRRKTKKKRDPPSDPGPEWPVNPPTPLLVPTSEWPQFKPAHSASPTQPLSAEGEAKITAMRIRQKVLERCREFFADMGDEDSDEDDESNKSERVEEEYFVDGNNIEESEEFKFFLDIFVREQELRSYYERNHENGEFSCLVCGGIGVKVGKRFKDCIGLVQHSTTISKTERKRAHRAFGHVVCRVLGWDIDRLPVIVLKGQSLGQSLASSSGLQGESKNNNYGSKDNTSLVKGNAGSLNPNNGELIEKEVAGASQSAGELRVFESSLKENNADEHVENLSNEVSLSRTEKCKEGAVNCQDALSKDDTSEYVEDLDKGNSDKGAIDCQNVFSWCSQCLLYWDLPQEVCLIASWYPKEWEEKEVVTLT